MTSNPLPCPRNNDYEPFQILKLWVHGFANIFPLHIFIKDSYGVV